MRIFIVFLFLSSFTLQAQELTYVESELLLTSEALGEERKVRLFHPEEMSDDAWALYVLDGNWNYELVKGVVGHWARWKLIPDVVVISIDNMGVRTRDMTPTADELRFPGSGGADRFHAFLERELMPTIQDRFPQLQMEVLFGHSFGGLFALHTLMVTPELFDGLIAVSPSIWWKDRYLYGDYPLKENEKKPFLLLTAGTNDRANTASLGSYVEWLRETQLDQQLELMHKILEGEDHFSNVPISLHHAIKGLFPATKWAADATFVLEEYGVDSLASAVEEWSAAYGVRFVFPLEAILAMSHAWFQSDDLDRSIRLLEWALDQESADYRVAYYLGNFHEKIDPRKAVEFYEEALSMGGMPDRMRTVIERAQLAQQARVPTLVGEGTLSTSQVETSIAFTPDGKKAYVTRHDGKWGSRSNPPSKIYEYSKVWERWQLVGLSSLSEEGTTDRDSDIFIGKDGSEAFFVSTRTYEGKEDANPDIWWSRRVGDRWGAPVPINEVNSSGYEASPVTDGEGNLYFSSMRPDGVGQGDLYRAERVEDGFAAPALLPGEINDVSGEWNCLVSEDARWIIFESSGRTEGLSSYGDLYISYQKNGVWDTPVHLAMMNSTGSDLNVRFIVDEKSLVFISSQAFENTQTDIFQIDIETVVKQ